MPTSKKRDHAIRAWITAELLRSSKSKSELAKALQIAPSAITRILDAERRVSIEELAACAEFFGDEASFRALLQEIFPTGILGPANDEGSSIPEMSDHLRILKEALQEVKFPREMINVFDSRAGDDGFDLYVRNHVFTSITYPEGLALSSPVSAIECPSDILSPRYLKGDLVLLTRNLDWKPKDIVFVRQPSSAAVDGETGMLIGRVTAANGPKMSIAIEHMQTGEVRPVKLSEWGDLGRVVLPNDILGYRD